MNSAKPAKPKASRQLSLTDTLPVGSKERAQLRSTLKPRVAHGGQLAKGKRKTARPFFAKAPMHVVLRSSRAKGLWSMLHRKNRANVQAMIYTYADRYKVHIYRASNVGNHLHLLVRAKDRKALADFLRVLSGQVACRITGAKKGVKKIGKFWDELCWSRLVNWGRDFSAVRHYLALNTAESYSPKLREQLKNRTIAFWEDAKPDELYGLPVPG